MEIHEKYMYRCLQLAKNGLGTTYPNPLVGSVIVLDDKIIGEGWHLKPGEPHAEVLAIQSVQDKNLLKKATIYVNLEPCSHYGKTPPCADLIIASGIKNVVIGNLDPNPEVAGRGLKKLLEAGCIVRSGVLENEGDRLNKRFFTFHKKKRPYIILKWAQTLDCFIAPLPETRNKKEPVWITNEYSLQRVHKMRGEEMAILTGTQTVLEDNPSLTTRNWAGENPVRVIIDRNLNIDAGAHVLDEKVKTIVLTEKDKTSSENLIYEKLDFSKETGKSISDVLYRHSIQSLIVEGGAKTLNTFIEEGLWDEAYIFTGNKIFGAGIPAPKLSGKIIKNQNFKEDRLTIVQSI